MNGEYDPEEQYGILFWTLDELVSCYGEVGVFQINDRQFKSEVQHS